MAFQGTFGHVCRVVAFFTILAQPTTTVPDGNTDAIELQALGRQDISSGER